MINNVFILYMIKINSYLILYYGIFALRNTFCLLELDFKLLISCLVKRKVIVKNSYKYYD